MNQTLKDENIKKFSSGMVAYACHPSTWKEGWGGRIADRQLYIVSSIWGQQYMVHSMLVWAKEWDPFSRLKFF